MVTRKAAPSHARKKPVFIMRGFNYTPKTFDAVQQEVAKLANKLEADGYNVGVTYLDSNLIAVNGHLNAQASPVNILRQLMGAPPPKNSALGKTAQALVRKADAAVPSGADETTMTTAIYRNIATIVQGYSTPDVARAVEELELEAVQHEQGHDPTDADHDGCLLPTFYRTLASALRDNIKHAQA